MMNPKKVPLVKRGFGFRKWVKDGWYAQTALGTIQVSGGSLNSG